MTRVSVSLNDVCTRDLRGFYLMPNVIEVWTHVAKKRNAGDLTKVATPVYSLLLAVFLYLFCSFSYLPRYNRLSIYLFNNAQSSSHSNGSHDERGAPHQRVGPHRKNEHE